MSPGVRMLHHEKHRVPARSDVRSIMIFPAPMMGSPIISVLLWGRMIWIQFALPCWEQSNVNPGNKFSFPIVPAAFCSDPHKSTVVIAHFINHSDRRFGSLVLHDVPLTPSPLSKHSASLHSCRTESTPSISRCLRTGSTAEWGTCTDLPKWG